MHFLRWSNLFLLTAPVKRRRKKQIVIVISEDEDDDNDDGWGEYDEKCAAIEGCQLPDGRYPLHVSAKTPKADKLSGTLPI